MFSLEVSLLVKWVRTIWGARENSNGIIKATVSSLGCHSGCGFSIVKVPLPPELHVFMSKCPEHVELEKYFTVSLKITNNGYV